MKGVRLPGAEVNETASNKLAGCRGEEGGGDTDIQRRCETESDWM